MALPEDLNGRTQAFLDGLDHEEHAEVERLYDFPPPMQIAVLMVAQMRHERSTPSPWRNRAGNAAAATWGGGLVLLGSEKAEALLTLLGWTG